MQLLLIGRDDDTGRRFAVPNGETLIGRRPDCHIVLDAPAIAPRHARVFSLDGRTVIYGLTTEWPIYVNGDTVHRRVLVHGDDIELAHYKLRCVDEAGVDPNEEAGTGAAAEAAGNKEAPDPLAAGARFPEPEATVPIDTADPGAGDAPAVDGPQTAGNAPIVEDLPAAGDLPTPGDLSTPEGLPAAGDLSTAGDLPATGHMSVDNPQTVDRPAEDPGSEDAAVDGRLLNDAPASPLTIAYHLDILSGINQGRRLDLGHPRVVLGFNQQRLVEIVQEDGTLAVRAIASQTEALINGEPMDDRLTSVGAGDVLSVQRIELQIQQRLLVGEDRGF